MKKQKTISRNKSSSKQLEQPNRQEKTKNYMLYWGSWNATKPTAEFFSTLSKKLLEWCSQTEGFRHPSAFFRDMGISKSSLFEWKEKSRELKEAFDLAKGIMNERLLLKGLEKEYDSSLVKATLPVYDEEWNAHLKEQRKEAENSQQGIKVVVLDKIPSSEMVPEKKEEND